MLQGIKKIDHLSQDTSISQEKPFLPMLEDANQV